MAPVLYIAEGFDDFVNGTNRHVGKYYHSSSIRLDPGVTGNFKTVAGRHTGGQALEISGNNAVFRVLNGLVTWHFFIAFAIQRKSNDNGTNEFFKVYNPDDSTRHVSLAFGGTNGQDLVVIESDGTEHTVSGVFPLDTWVWLCLRVNFADNGRIRVYGADASQLIDVDPADTRGGTSNRPEAFGFFTVPNTYLIDDFFFADSGGTTWNDVIPDFRIQHLSVTAIESATWGFTGTWSALTSADEDNSYVKTHAFYNTRLIARVQDATGITNTRGLVINSRSRVNDSTIRHVIHGVYDQSTGDVWSSGTIAIVGNGSPSPYVSAQYTIPINPFTDSDWTDSGINNVRLVFSFEGGPA